MRVALELLHRSRVAVNDENTEFAGSYSIVNLIVGLEQRGAGWRLTEFLRVDNLGDRSYVGSVVVGAAGDRFYEPAPTRNVLVGVQASLEF